MIQNLGRFSVTDRSDKVNPVSGGAGHVVKLRDTYSFKLYWETEDLGVYSVMRNR